MLNRFDIRKASLTLAIVFAIIVVALPVCQMMSCGMTGTSMPGMFGSTAISNVCEAASMGARTTPGVVPPGAEMLILALGLLIAALVAPISPASRSFRLVPAVVFSGSPPPDPLGVRLTL